MSRWVGNGLDPTSYWLQTPRTLFAVLEGFAIAADERASIAWLTAQLGRAKKFPSLKRVLARGAVEQAELTATEPDELLAVFEELRDKVPGTKITWEPHDG